MLQKMNHPFEAVDAASSMLVKQGDSSRRLEPQWNKGLIVASIAISLLGAFTSTQLMCQARTTRHFSGVLVWTMLGSLTFGFCSIWSLHEVAMLACELDLPMGIDVPLTILSSVLAVFFTFAALASDLLWDRHMRGRQGKNQSRKRSRAQRASLNRLSSATTEGESSEPLLPSEEYENEARRQQRESLELESPSRLSLIQRLSRTLNENATIDSASGIESPARWTVDVDPSQLSITHPLNKSLANTQIDLLQNPELSIDPQLADETGSESGFTDSIQASSDYSNSRRSSTCIDSSASSAGLGNLIGIRAYQKSAYHTENLFIVSVKVFKKGFTSRNIIKGFFWSLAITGMHYVGIFALRIPKGYVVLNPIFVVLSATVSWIVCSLGCILMSQMETRLSQQFVFSIVATTGVATMHFTGMRAATFWSRAPASNARGYPPALAIAIASIAITTCILANGLLAHSATVSRNKLAEVVLTRRKLWMAIAQKENAESAAAAKSDFIASASHEIRTPLFHIQGYSDLLSRTELTEEGRLLLYAIQHATKTLSLITNNVLDWSRLERDGGEAILRPISLDMRTVCESIINLFPDEDDEERPQVMVVVAPEVPNSLFLDETYICRILMNLVSNALKFTSSGYILLLLEMKNDKLIATVKDTGCGVPPSFLPQLFEPFKQAQTRGSQRGTGLGLSIIKRLLQKMGGAIEVESRHQDSEDVRPEQTGSTFTITIPVQQSTNPTRDPPSKKITSKIAIFHEGNARSLEGLCLAWEKFEFDVIVAKKFSDLSGANLKYIWADPQLLRRNPVLLRKLLEQDQWLVLVPFEKQATLQEIPVVLSAPQFIPIRKPLIWHSITKSIAAASKPSNKAGPGRMVRFAPKVNVLDGADKEKHQEESIVKNLVILLVEDNQINRKLGTKMLTSLGYQVLLAEDGQEAIEQVIRHDDTIDAILMDCNMPVLDGLASAERIRALEAAGTLSRRRPIIAVTAVVSHQSQTECRLAGMDDFLAKPLSLARLEQTLAAHLSLTCK